MQPVAGISLHRATFLLVPPSVNKKRPAKCESFQMGLVDKNATHVTIGD